MGTTEIRKNNRKRRNRKQGSAEAAGSEIERSERAGATGPERRIGAAESRNSGRTEDNNQYQYRRQVTSVLNPSESPEKKEISHGSVRRKLPRREAFVRLYMHCAIADHGIAYAVDIPVLMFQPRTASSRENSSPYVPHRELLLRIRSFVRSCILYAVARQRGSYTVKTPVRMFPIANCSFEYGPVRRWFRPEIPIRSARTPSYRAFASQ